MFFRRMLCALLALKIVGACLPGYAQSARETELPPAAPQSPAEPEPAPAPAPTPAPTPAPDGKDRVQPGQQALDGDAQSQLQVAEERRLWQDVLAKRKAGQSEQALASYVLYLNAAYAANKNQWLLLELGRTLEKLGQPEEALRSYRRYLLETSEQKEYPGNQREAELAVARLEGKFKRTLNIQFSTPSRHYSPNGVTLSGLICLPIGVVLEAISIAGLLSFRPESACDIYNPKADCGNYIL